MIYSCCVYFYISVCLMVAVIDIRQKDMSIHVNHCLTTVIACGDCLLHVVCMSIGAIDLSACIQMLPLACSCSRLHAVTPARMQLYPRVVACMQLDGAVHAGRGPRHSIPPSNPFSHASNLDFRHRTTMS